MQAEDIATFTTEVSISVPPSTPPPLAVGTYYMIGDPPHAQLDDDEPGSAGGNKTAKFDFTSTDITTENRAPGQGGSVYYVSWSIALADGLRFDNQKVQVHFTRTSGTGSLTAGIFNCPAGVHGSTITSDGCVLVASGSSTGEQIDIGPFTHTIHASREMRLKMVNLTSDKSAIQWGYKENNRSARIVILAPGVA